MLVTVKNTLVLLVFCGVAQESTPTPTRQNEAAVGFNENGRIDSPVRCPEAGDIETFCVAAIEDLSVSFKWPSTNGNQYKVIRSTANGQGIVHRTGTAPNITITEEVYDEHDYRLCHDEGTTNSCSRPVTDLWIRVYLTKDPCLACLTSCNDGSDDVSYKSCRKTRKVMDCLLDTCANGPCNINGNGRANTKQLCKVYKQALQWTTPVILHTESRLCAQEKCPDSAALKSEECTTCEGTCLTNAGGANLDPVPCSNFNEVLKCQSDNCATACGFGTVQNKCVAEKTREIVAKSLKTNGIEAVQVCNMGCNGASPFE